ncbi:MAG TPA: transporter associated domain-containing protein [Burkholderiaceae bacterium]|nr:transporter associated domain-containing protein [Burkholderiaceae bacterium]
MTDPHSRTQRLKSLGETDSPKRQSFFERLSSLLLREPEDREQLLDVLQAAHERNLVDADGLSMMEGVLQVGELTARDIMVPGPQMDMIDVAEPLEAIIPEVIRTAHSRFPVYDGDRENIIGILLAKDLLRYYQHDDFDLRGMLRPVVFIPESKRLNVLLRDFRSNRNHLAIVVDEYGNVSGLITIEDVLEQIVGDIEDEHDQHDEDADAILATGDGRWRVKALTDIAQFNETFGTDLGGDGFDTIGGYVTGQFGRVPHRGETIALGPLRFEVLRGDARHVQMLLVERVELLEPQEQPEHASSN